MPVIEKYFSSLCLPYDWQRFLSDIAVTVMAVRNDKSLSQTWYCTIPVCCQTVPVDKTDPIFFPNRIVWMAKMVTLAVAMAIMVHIHC